MSYKLCRACLTVEETFTYFLFDNVSPEVYWYCTSIEIHNRKAVLHILLSQINMAPGRLFCMTLSVKEDDKLSRAICDICYNLLSKFCDFKQTCIQSQNSLQRNCDSITPGIKLNHDFIKDTNNIKQEIECPNIVEDNSDQNDFGFDTKVEITLQEENSKNGSYDQEVSKMETKGTVGRSRNIQRRLRKKTKHSSVNTAEKAKKSEIRGISCDLCDKKFHSIISCKIHKLRHNNKELSIQCTECTKIFKTLSGLRRHLESSHTKFNLLDVTCKTCGKVCKSKQTLKLHHKTHGERRLFVCDICGKNFTSVYSLKIHVETHTENREKRFTCEHCGKKFLTNSSLSTHVTQRHTGRRYICDICNYPFTAKENLVKHLLLHDGKKLYKCDICQKAFGASSTLVEHLRIHSGERPYMCSYCPKSFLSKKRLTDHHRIHTGEKPYKCNVCDQAFTQCGTLNRHKKVHDRN